MDCDGSGAIQRLPLTFHFGAEVGIPESGRHYEVNRATKQHFQSLFQAKVRVERLAPKSIVHRALASGPRKLTALQPLP